MSTSQHEYSIQFPDGTTVLCDGVQALSAALSAMQSVRTPKEKASAPVRRKRKIRRIRKNLQDSFQKYLYAIQGTKLATLLHTVRGVDRVIGYEEIQKKMHFPPRAMGGIMAKSRRTCAELDLDNVLSIYQDPNSGQRELRLDPRFAAYLNRV